MEFYASLSLRWPWSSTFAIGAGLCVLLLIAGSSVAAGEQPSPPGGAEEKDPFVERFYGFGPLSEEEVVEVRQMFEIPEREREMSDRELVDKVVSSESGWAAEAVRLRYRTGTKEEQERLVELYKEAAWASPHPEKSRRETRLSLFGTKSARIFPPELAVPIAKELLLDSRIFEGERTFLAMTQNMSTLSGPLLAQVLHELYQELVTNGRMPADKGLVEEGILVTLGGCGEAGFEILKTIPRRTEGWIAGVGTIANEESTRLLLDVYQQDDSAETRLAVLAALTTRLFHVPDDNVLRTFLQTELGKYLLATNLHLVRSAAGKIPYTHDPFFLPELERVREAIAQDSSGYYHWENSIAEDIPGLRADLFKKMDEAIEQLKKEQAKQHAPAP